jgi:aspartate aminotransferase
MMDLAERVGRIQPSATLAMTQRAKDLKAKGVDVLAFGIGEPDFDTPVAIREAAKAALDAGATHYTAVGGVPPLLEAIQARSLTRRGVRHDTSEIVVSVGAKHSLFNLSMVLYGPGDEVIIPAPYWVSYPDQVRLVGGTPVVVPTREEEGFRLTPERLRSHLTPKTRSVVLCSPSNPTGAAYSAEHLEALAEVLAEGDYWIIVDEIYGELVYDGFEQKSLLTVAPQLKDRLLIVDGVSKTYAMTGWRIGWTLGPTPVVKAVAKIQGQSTTNPAAVSQHAAIAALSGDQAPVEAMRQAFAKRRRRVIDGLNAIEGLSCREPEGAFYAFLNASEWVGKTTKEGKVIEDDIVLAHWLLEEARCALVPGTAFGAPGYLRMSYATSEEVLDEGLRRIAAAGASLS